MTAGKKKKDQDLFDCVFIFHVLICVFQQLKGKKPPVASNGVTGKGKTLSSQPKKADPAAGVKRTASSKYTVGCLAFWLQVHLVEPGLSEPAHW